MPGSRPESEDDVILNAKILLAARKIVLARLGEKYKIFGCDPPGENDSWTFWVELENSRPASRKLKAIYISQEQLDEVIESDLDIAQIKGTKPKPAEVRENVRREYGDGVDELFEERE